MFTYVYDNGDDCIVKRINCGSPYQPHRLNTQSSTPVYGGLGFYTIFFLKHDFVSVDFSAF